MKNIMGMVAVSILSACSVGAGLPNNPSIDASEEAIRISFEQKVQAMAYDSIDNGWGDLVITTTNPLPLESVSYSSVVDCYPRRFKTLGKDILQEGQLPVPTPVQSGKVTVHRLPIIVDAPSKSICAMEGLTSINLGEIQVKAGGITKTVKVPSNTDVFEPGNIGRLAIASSGAWSPITRSEPGRRNWEFYKMKLSASIDEDIQILSMRVSDFSGFHEASLVDQNGLTLAKSVDEVQFPGLSYVIPMGSSRDLSFVMDEDKGFTASEKFTVVLTYMGKTSLVKKRIAQEFTHPKMSP